MAIYSMTVHHSSIHRFFIDANSFRIRQLSWFTFLIYGIKPVRVLNVIYSMISIVS
jgi:hypothetical protein